MRNLKKVIALIAVLALTLSTVALGATYTDVAEDSAYSVAVESLSKLGIVTGYEDGTYGPEKAVTRAEMAALIARIQGYEDVAKAQTNTAFTDVPSTYWASGYVAYASNQKIVNGYGDGTFGPDDSVKYEQAVTMIMRTLGYEYYASTNGGYPTGYLAAAQRYGLTKGVSNAVAGTDANRGTIAQLLYNAIDTPIMAPYAWSSNGDIEYAVYDGSDKDREYRTLMSENLGVIKIKGLVVSNGAVNIEGGSDIKLDSDAEVTVKLIDTYDSNHSEFSAYKTDTVTEMEAANVQKKFLVGDSDIDTFVGNRVILYAVEDNNSDKFVVISCALDTSTNDTVEFTLDQFDSLKIDGSKREIKYFKDGANDTTSVKLQDGDDTLVVFNNYGIGKNVDTVFSGGAVVKNSVYGGKVTLVDNDSKSGYDLVIVEVGATAVVDEVNGDKVTFKESASIVKYDGTTQTLANIKVDEDADDEIITFIKDGEEIEISDLNEWDVLTLVVKDKNADYIVAEVIGTPVTGTITGTKASKTSAAVDTATNSGVAFRIDGVAYDVAANAYKADKLQIGDAGIFYVDKYGKIAAFDEDSTVAGAAAGNYGFVLRAGVDGSGVNDGVFQVKLLTANGVDVYDFATKVSYYYTGSATRTTVESDTLTVRAFEGANKHNLIKYTTNASGEINTIYEAGYDADKFAKVNDISAAASVKWDADNFTLGGQAIDENATIFFLSTTAHTGAGNGDITINGADYDLSTSDSFVGTISDLDDDEKYNYIAYLDSKGDDANLVVITTGYSNTGTTSNIAVISDASTGQNDEIEDIYVLDYFQDGEFHEGVATTNAVYVENQNDISEGDIVKVKVNSAGVITGLTMLVDFNSDIRKATGEIDGTLSVHKALAAGATGESYDFNYATAYTKATKTVTINGESYKLSNAQNVYTIDASVRNGKVDLGSAGDFEWDKDMPNSVRAKYADYVFARKYDGRVEDVVIVKNIIEDYDKNTDYTAGQNAVVNAKTTETAKKNAYNTAKETFDTATETYEAAKGIYDAALAVWNASAKADADATTMNAAVTTYNAAVTTYNTAIATFKTAAQAWSDAADTLEALDDTYDADTANSALTAVPADVTAATPVTAVSSATSEAVEEEAEVEEVVEVVED